MAEVLPGHIGQPRGHCGRRVQRIASPFPVLTVNLEPIRNRSLSGSLRQFLPRHRAK